MTSEALFVQVTLPGAQIESARRLLLASTRERRKTGGTLHTVAPLGARDCRPNVLRTTCDNHLTADIGPLRPGTVPARLATSCNDFVITEIALKP